MIPIKNILLTVIFCISGYLLAQTYRVGDTYVAPDGSKGIVYYLFPDGTGGWVVALDDASTGCPWGDATDVSGLLTNNLATTQYQRLFYDTAGYANTQIIRNYQNNSTAYAAGKVDFEHGWVLPAPAQLSTLFAQLPFISSAILNAGGTLPVGECWCSAERTASQAYIVNFQVGYLSDRSKTSNNRVRAVRSFSYEASQPELSYSWSTGDHTQDITVTPTQTSTYTVTVSTSGGCADTAEHTIVVNQGTYNSETAIACESYTWHNEEYAESGVNLFEYVNESGCPSTDTLHLTVNQPTAATMQVSVLENALPFILNGESYDTEGTYTQTLTNVAGCDSILTINITVISTVLPDNIDSADCVFFPEGTEWGIAEPIVSQMAASMCASVPLVGDVDDDGQQEIVMHTSSKVLIFNADATLKNQFNIASSQQEGQLGIAKVQYGQGEYKTIIVSYSTSNKYFYAYDATGALLWQSDHPFTSHNGEQYQMPAISFADFNHDGWTEMYAGAEIYDAATGVLLCKTNGNKGYAGRTWATNYSTYQSSAADMYGDMDLELVVGNSVYDVDIQSRTDVSLNNLSSIRTLEAAEMTLEDGTTIPFSDGNTFLVDVNLDGRLDVLVMNVDQSNRIVYLYVWDAESQSMICSKRIINARKFGMPQIGDIDNDGFPEICFIVGTYNNHQPGNNETIFALKYDFQNQSEEMDVLWTTSHSDFSGATSLTLFDFNQDGYSELVYRDENHLRIMNGSMHNHQTGEAVASPYDLATYACGSGTALEYPIVCDVDLDGAAEIIIGSSCVSSSHYGHLYIFKSSGEPWAPARKVWNQYMYNVTNVNEDLTIPQYQFNNATVFTDPEGVVRRPFNNFLQQATTIDQYGRPFYAVPDVAMETSASSQMTGDTLALTFSYCNTGDNTLNAPYSIAVFANAYGGDVVGTATINESLPVDSCTQGYIQLPISSLCGFQSLDNLVIAVNCAGAGIAQNGGQQPECDTTNNTVSVAVTMHTDTTHLTASACDSYIWYGDTLTQSGTYTHTLTNAGGCDSVVAVDLTIIPLPTLTHTPDTVIINGTSATLWVSGADILYWTDGNDSILSSDDTLTVSPETTTVYYINGQNNNADIGDNLVVNGDFEQGNTGFISSYQDVTSSHNMYFGRYAVTTDGQLVWGGDHLYGYGGTGQFMLVDGATIPNSVIWRQTVSVIPNTYYAFSAQVTSTGNSVACNAFALLQFSVNDTQLGDIFHSPEVLNVWQPYYEVWYSGNNTSATLTILNQNNNGEGNDFGLDDISFIPLTECSVTDSICVIVSGFPDNIDSADCIVDALQQPWDAQVLHSVNDIHCYFTPLVGDIDGDGEVEIVAIKVTSNSYHTTQLGIYRGSDLQQIGTIDVPQKIYSGYAGPAALVRYPDGNGGLQGAIVLHCYDKKLRSYDINGQLLATSDANTPCIGVVSVIDFNADGWPEIYVGNSVYDAATLKLLCAGPASGNMGRCYRGGSSDSAFVAMPVATNVLGDLTPELICGNSIYSVNVVSRTDVSQNSVDLVKTIPIPNHIPQDGNVAVADFDMDGRLEVLVTIDETPSSVSDSSFFYAYKPDTEEILFVHGRHALAVGFPFVGDIDGDGWLEFVYIDKQSSVSNARINAMKYIPSTGLQTMWQASHTDASGQTSMTLFDFNQDGIMEIVYRDESHLRIINGSGKSHLTGNDTIPFYNLYTVGMTAGTWNEYPVVADVNNDRRAEIVVCGKIGSGLGFVGGQLVVLGGIHPWAPARKVWNQYMYNVTNVNEDLTIPQYQFNNATAFTDPESVVRRPFNNFLQQATTIDQYGRPFYAVPDVAMEASASSQMTGDTLALTFSYCNTGDNTLNAPYTITVFANAYGGDTVCTVSMNESLPVDSCVQGNIHLPSSTLCGFQSLDNLVIAVNCAGAGIAQNGGQQPECDTTNNTVTVNVTLHADTTHLTASACDSYLWYGDTLTQSGTYTHTLTNASGCDSVEVLHLTVSQTPVRWDTLHLSADWLPYSFTAADTIFPVGIPDSSGFTWWIPAGQGCDTMVMQTVLVYPTMTVAVTGTINTDCIGRNCFYDGPTIMINEVMLAPQQHDGSIAGSRPSTDDRGEWIELYNPHKCDSVDISCYFLGNNANDNGNYGGGFALPQGTVVPPQGFCVVRGVNAPAVPADLLVLNGGNVVEVVVDDRYCYDAGGQRLWFPNAGGWFAFYDAEGVPQDAICWYDSNYSCRSCHPCLPEGTGCGFIGMLPSYDSIPSDRKNYITSLNPNNYRDLSFRRIPDGGAWQNTPVTPTYGSCNAECVEPAPVTCNAIAVVTVQGGMSQYSYQWDDAALQTTDTAFALCAGTYTVTVTDGLGTVMVQQVTISDFVPEISHEDMAFCLSDTFGVLQGFPLGGFYEGATVANDTLFFEANVSDYQMTYTYIDSNGCSATTDFQVAVGLNVVESDSVLCSIDLPVYWNGDTLMQSGVYTHTFANATGCDSVEVLNLSVFTTPVRWDTLRLSVDWLPYTFAAADTIFPVGIPDSSGFTWWIPANEGCDTMVMQTVLVYPTMTATVTGTVNTDCIGRNCFYNGPTIMINEVMLAPQQHDGSIAGSRPSTDDRGEWIELYNPHKCDSVDISCYFLGNNANDNGNYGGGFALPQGTVVPPQGFCVVRGVNAPAVPADLLVLNGGNVVEVVVDDRYCYDAGGQRLWFPNAGGWFAFYDAEGVPQDAICWYDSNYSCRSCHPCLPEGTGCGFIGMLASYDSIPSDRKNYITSLNPNNYRDLSFHRIPDGGAWENIPAAPTYGSCNAECVPPAESTGNAIAVANVTGGAPPYSYLWNDPEGQTTDTAFSLSAGTYSVTVTDFIGDTVTVTVLIQNFVPSVSQADGFFCLSDTMNVLQGYPAGGTYDGAEMTGDTLFFEPGVSQYVMTYTFADSNGCTATDTFQVMVAQNIFETVDTVCSNELPILWHGLALEEPGFYTVTLPNTDGCDSVITMQLTVTPTSENTLSVIGVENNLPYIFNGISYSAPGTYYQHFTNAAGCDSTVTLQLTVYYNQTVAVDSTVCGDALPVVWNDSVFTASGTKTRVYPAANGADSIVVMTLHVNSSPVAAISGLTALCADSMVTLTADSAYSYLWSTGDTTQAISVTEEGFYTLTVTNEYGCEAVTIHQLSSLGNPILSVTLPDMCAGDSYTFSVGHQGSDNIHLGRGETTLSLTDMVFLPDGVYCEPRGCSYHSPLTFTAYAPGSTIQSADDIHYVRLNMEHSYIGDLYINITCPNGQKADLLKYGGSGSSECNDQIPTSSRGWAEGDNMPGYTFLGNAYDYNVSTCDPSAFGNEPGEGWNYCWSDNTTQGYTYSTGAGGYIYRFVNTPSTGAGSIVDSSDVAAGTQFYHPDDPFSNLIGCPLNGPWYIEVQDGWNSDNGYIFGWELALSSEMLPDISFELAYTTADGPWITVLSDSLFQIDPPANLGNDTTVVYTFTVYDTTGCAYDTTVSVNFYAIRHTELDTVVCEGFVWNDSLHTTSGQYVRHFVSAAGCDSVSALNLTVNSPTDTTIHIVVLENALPYQYNEISYVEAGTYTQYLTNAVGCDSILTVTLTVFPNVTTELDSTVCESDLPVIWNGIAFTAAGTDSVTLQAATGADSAVVMTLHVVALPVITHSADTVIMPGASVNLWATGADIMAWTDADGNPLSSGSNLTVAPTVTTTYYITAFNEGNSVVTNGDFESGNAGFTTAYQYNSNLWPEGNYYVGTNAHNHHGNFPNWYDHTTGSGLYMIVNGATVAGTNLWTQTVPVIPHTSYAFSAWVCTLVGGYSSLARLQFSVNATQLGDIFHSPSSTSVWNRYYEVWYSGENTTATLTILNQNTTGGGNDFGVDDIQFSPLNFCNVTDSVTVYVSGQTDSTVCADALPFIWNGVEFTVAGTQTATITASDGTDSVVVMNLHVNALSYNTFDTAVVENALPLQYNGISYVEAGTYTQYFTNALGCDSILTIHLTVYQNVTSTVDTTVCAAALPLTWNDSVFTAAGTKTTTILAHTGADSVVTMTLHVNPLSYTTIDTAVIENALPLHYNEISYVEAGTYTQYLTNAAGCDSVLTVLIDVIENVSVSVDSTVCEAALPYTWHGHSFTAAGTHMVTLFTSHGADSVVTYHLSVDNIAANIGNITHITCYGESTGSATASVTGGQTPMTYAWTNASGTNIATTTSIGNRPAGAYTFTVTDHVGCTATASVTLNTLNGELQPGTIAASQEVCDGEDIVPFTGTAASGGNNGGYQWQTSTNGTDWAPAPGTANAQGYTYPNTAAYAFSLRRAWVSQSCGTVYSNTVTVSVWPNSIDTITASVCQGETYTEYNFDISADQTAEAGVYTYEQHHATGHCDSAVILLLTVNPTVAELVEATVCEGEGYDANGFSVSPQETIGESVLTRVQNLQTVNGCDSVVTLQLTIIDTALRVEMLTDDFCEHNEASLTVLSPMSDYVWSTGETATTIVVTSPGIYSVTASEGGCSATAHIRVEGCHYELVLPNAITPSRGDGLNDCFYIPEGFTPNINLFKVYIYNRWGELVFYSTDKNFRWYGEYRGQTQYQTIYNYVIEYTDTAGRPQRLVGSITVL